MKVLCDWDIPPEERAVVEAWPAGIDVIEGGGKLDARQRQALAPTIDVHSGLMRTVTRDWVESATNLKLINLTGHGVDLLLRDGLPDLIASRGIKVATADGAGIAIAEHIMMAMTMLSRQVLRSHDALAWRGKWEGRRGPELFGSTLCIIGFGGIGQETAIRAAAFGMKVGIVTRNPDKYRDHPTPLAFATSYDTIDAAIAKADYVVVTAPLTTETANLIDRTRLAAMKEGAYLVSITRGPVIEEKALFEALQSGRLAGAALDCWWHEEEDGSGRDGYPADLPFHQFNVLMTPHCSGTTFGTRQRALRLVGDNIGRLMRGEPLRNEVSHDDLKTMAAGL